MYHRELDHMSEQYVNRSQRQLPSQLFNHLNSILPLDCTDDCFNMPSPAVPPSADSKGDAAYQHIPTRWCNAIPGQQTHIGRSVPSR